MNFNFSYNFDDNQKVWDVIISGEIDIYNSNELREHLISLIEKSKNSIHMDFSRLEYIDSTGLGSLVSILKRVKEYNGYISIKNLTPNIQKVFKITNLGLLFKIEGGALHD